MDTYRFQHRVLEEKFLTIKAYDLAHAREIMTKQGDNPLHWRLSKVTT